MKNGKKKLLKLFCDNVLKLFIGKYDKSVQYTDIAKNSVEKAGVELIDGEVVINISQKLKDLYEKKSLGIKTAENVRQLGGYITKDGRKVKDGLLLRGTCLSELSDEEINILKNKYNLKEIIDFRVPEARKKICDRDIDGVNNTGISVLDVKVMDKNLEKICDDEVINTIVTYYKYHGGLDILYLYLVNNKNAQKGYRQFFDILLNNDGATYWHCTSGKDRTGFAAVLLLSVFGVDEKTILDDYELTLVAKESQMRFIAELLKNKNLSDEDVKELVSFVGVKRTAMENALREIDNKYGGMNAYLHNQINLTDEKMQILKNKYLE